MHTNPQILQDLAFSFGSEGIVAELNTFVDPVYSGLLEATTLTIPGGRAFLPKLGGATGDEIADDCAKVLVETGITGYPFIQAAPYPYPGSEGVPLVVRVDNTKLLGMNAYLIAFLTVPDREGEASVISLRITEVRESDANLETSLLAPFGIDVIQQSAFVVEPVSWAGTGDLLF